MRKGKFTIQNREHKSTLAQIAIFISWLPRLDNNVLLNWYLSWDVNDDLGQKNR